MKILNSEKRLCTCCMEEHVVKAVLVKAQSVYKDEIVSFMHRERAYEETAPRDMIRFQYAEHLQL